MAQRDPLTGRFLPSGVTGSKKPPTGKRGGIVNLTSLLRKLEKIERHSKKVNNGSVIVGYSASYAVYVHENVEEKWRGRPRRSPSKGNYWDPAGRGRSKFLEYPARTIQRELGTIIAETTKRGASVMQALLIAGMRLQRESQLLVPVDTGNLKASAFTEKE